MKAIHIIPAVFNYFDDIRTAAFGLVDNLQSAGIESDIFTLQYGSAAAAPSVQAEVKEVTPKAGRTYKGQLDITKAIESFSDYDIVHLHAPFFGAAGKLLAWKQAHPETPFIFTCHRRAITPDFLSLFLKLYSLYYLPKIFMIGDLVAVPSVPKFQAYFGASFKKNKDKIIEIDDSSSFLGQDVSTSPDGAKLKPDERLALKYIMVYNELIRN